MKFNKKTVTKAQIDPLCEKYKISPILASIFVRRGITEGKELFYYLENDIHFEHNPFMFSQMEDAVDRILAAKEEGEKVLVFGDRDVDGITSTAILYGYLKKMGLDVSWRLPTGDEAYGLTLDVVENFAKENGTLIITVDCGISCVAEVERANSLGIDVIVTDHHNPPETVPDAVCILDAKMEDETYPFKEISGAAVAYKLVSALRFAQSSLYKTDICLLNVEEGTKDNGIPEGTIQISVLKVRNNTKYRLLTQNIVPGQTSFQETKLPYFLGSNYIYVWDSRDTIGKMNSLFGSGIEFSFMDLRTEISRIWPAFTRKTLDQLKSVSKAAKYETVPCTEIEALFNLYITYASYMLSTQDKNLETDRELDLELAGIAAQADIMPMKDENRLFVKSCVKSINSNHINLGLSILLSKLKLNYANLNATDLGWTVIPCLNAAGRMGQSELSLKLLLSENAQEAQELAQAIISLNEDRKKFVNDALYYTKNLADESMEKSKGKLVVVADDRVHKGLTGLLAGKYLGEYKVPSLAVTKVEDTYSGSMRCPDSVVATEFLKSFGEDFFITYGGHNAAAGFSFAKEKLGAFMAKAMELSAGFKLEKESEALDIDAEVPPQYLTPELLQTVKLFEPYGNENDELLFYSSSLRIADAKVMGAQSQHLKVSLDTGTHKFPAIFWNASEKFNRDFGLGDSINVLYSMNENYFNGTVTPQMIVKSMWK